MNIRKDSNIALGDRKKTPLIFLHGFMGNRNDWLKIAKRFQRDYFCILPDLIGHGDNTFFPKNIPIFYKNYSDQILTILDQLKIEKTTLIGYSMGGRIALHTAIKYPDRINKLVIESANPGIENEKDRQLRMEEDKSRAEAIELNGLDSFVETWYQSPLFKSLKNHPQILSKMVSDRKKNDPIWMKKLIRELSPGKQPSLWGSLGKTNLATLLISGELDEKYQKIMGDCKTKIKGSKFCSIKNAGHNSHTENPSQFTDCLIDFLEENKEQ